MEENAPEVLGRRVQFAELARSPGLYRSYYELEVWAQYRSQPYIMTKKSKGGFGVAMRSDILATDLRSIEPYFRLIGFHFNYVVAKKKKKRKKKARSC